MTDQNTLEWLRAENARLIALLDAHNIEWWLPQMNGGFWINRIVTIDKTDIGKPNSWMILNL